MREVWTANIAAKKHLFNISNAEIAARYNGGVSENYICMILKGERKTKGAQERIEAIVEEIIKERK